MKSAEGLIINEIQPGDICPISLLEREAFTSPWTEAMFRQEASLPLSRGLVARGREGDQALLGYLIFWLVSGEFHLQKLAVRKGFRRQGIASALLSQALAEAIACHCRSATLEVRRSNAAALRLYKRFGFTVEGIRPRYYDDTGEDALILSAELPDSFRRGDSRPDEVIKIV